MTNIRIYQTHIEVYPYSLGDSERLEKSLSKYDPIYHKWDPISYYVLGNTLYLPRGISLNLLQRVFNATPILDPKADEYETITKGEIKVSPKSSMQEDAIKFLTAKGRFSDYRGKNQFVLNLDTGDGKTVAAITAILALGYRAMIIVHQIKIKQQWLDTFKDKTDVNKRQIMDIDGRAKLKALLTGKEKERDIYIVNHQTLSSYARENGWNEIRELFKKLKIGIKVIDEAHLFFENTLKIDFFSNTLLSFYLTATFGRADNKEAPIYKKAFFNAARFGEETFNYDDKRKHIHLIIVYFRSKPLMMKPSVRSKLGFSAYKYIDYEMSEQYGTLDLVLQKMINETSHMEGKTLIVSPKIDSAEYYAKVVRKFTGEDVGTIHSGNSSDVNELNESKRYISSTPKSLGTGVDLKGLRIIINLEPMGKINMDQLRGRLREYAPDKDTYLIYPIDTTLPDVLGMLKRAMPMFREKCKEIVAINLDV